jgi:hypothetical protein
MFMDAPKSKVKCSVKDCQYNKRFMCEAGSIEVNPMGDNNVNTCDGTKCSTFTKNATT